MIDFVSPTERLSLHSEKMNMFEEIVLAISCLALLEVIYILLTI